MAHYDIFRHHLLITAPAYGYALWDPDPGNLYPAVEVGDVGYIREGRFHRLFNVLLPAKHPSHRKGVPEYHEQLNIEDHIIHGTLSPHNFCSTCVALGPESDRQADGPQNEGEVSFLCRMSQGAVLCLPIKAKKEDTVAITSFGEWMIRHIDTWFAWAQKLGLGVYRMEDIILVTGTHRTRSYTNVAFPGGREDAQASFRANLKVDHPDEITINWQLSHEHIRGAHLNPGPDGKNLPEDQCIFIRGFRVARKYKIFPRLRAAAGPNPDPEGYDEEPDTEMELVPVPAVPEYRDPLHILLGFIAEEAPHCDMVLVHDNDLAELHGIYDGTPIESLRPDAMLSHFRSAELKIHEVPFGLDLLAADNGGNAGTETVRIATLSNLFEELSPSSISPSSQSRCHVKTPLPQIEGSLLHVPLKRGRTLFQSSESGDSSTTSMSHAHPATTHIQEPIETALKEYEERTGINLLEYHLAVEFETCYSAHSVIEILQAQSRKSQRLRDDGDKLMVWVKPVVHLLYALSISGALGGDVSVPSPARIAIFAGIGVLLDAPGHVGASNDALCDFFESMEYLLRPLDICTETPPTTATTTILMKILVELLSILAIGAQQLEQGLPLVQYDTIDLGSKLFGIKGVEVVRQRLGRLNQEEARATVVQILEVVYGLFKHMKAVMNGGESSISELRDALVTMQLVTSNMNSEKRSQSQTSSQRWLSPPDPSKNHISLRLIHQEGTTAWALQGDTFREWTAAGSLLWVHGKLGSGKSVLCSMIIENIKVMCEAGLASLAYFYFDARDTAKQDIRGLLTSLLFQLSARSDLCCDILSTLYHEHGSGSRQPDNDILTQRLKDMLTTPEPGPMYIIVDAIDECPNISGTPSPRGSVLGLLDELVQLKRPDLHICVTSRLESDIETVLRPLSSHSIFLDDNTGNDIFDYISAVVNTDRKMRTWTAEDQRLVIDTLSEKADGMFRWVSCQLDALRRSLPINTWRALEQLPEQLDPTYENALERIGEEDWEYAHRFFQCLTVASRPLLVEELAEFLMFDFSSSPGSVPKFVENRRHKNPREAVLSACSSLITVVDVSGRHVVYFSHFSFREFLTSGRLAIARGPVNRYHISLEHAHTTMAQACLGLLLQSDRVDPQKIDGWPLAEYAARYWVIHAQFGNVSSSIRNAMESLFDPNNPYFMVWVSIWDVDEEWSTSRPLDAPRKHTATALYYAALCGFRDMVEWLVTRHRQDVNARGGNYVTPLRATSARGYLNVALLLLEHGADVNLADDFGQTPLHLAAKMGHSEMAALLLEHGGNVDAKDVQQQTPLFYAVQEGQLEVTRVLVRCGAYVGAQDKDGETALHFAAQKNHLEIPTLLLGHGATANALNTRQLTPLHYAARNGNLEATRVLLLHGADVEARTLNRQTALHLAALKNHSEVATLLLEHGANANAKSLDELTPLLCAAQEGQLDVMRILLLHAADIRDRTLRGEIALHLAARDNHSMAATLLLEHGFNANDPTPVSGGGDTAQAEVFDTISRGSPTPSAVPSLSWSHHSYDSLANSAISRPASVFSSSAGSSSLLNFIEPSWTTSADLSTSDHFRIPISRPSHFPPFIQPFPREHQPRASGGSRERGSTAGPNWGALRVSPYPATPSSSPALITGPLPDPGLGNGPPPLINMLRGDAIMKRRINDAKFACPIPGCGATFTRHFNLKGHLRSHNDEKPFQCKWPGCGKGFQRQHDCKRHEQLHSNNRPFICEGCRKPFARLDALNRHLRSEGGSSCIKAQESSPDQQTAGGSFKLEQEADDELEDGWGGYAL